MYMALLTKPAPTAVATDEMDLVLVEAATLGVDEDVIKSMKKKNEEAKKAQNAKKIADRKAKKPPSDPPKPPDKPEAHPAVEVLKQGLEGAMAKAEAKLLEAQTTVALMAAKDPKILTAEALLDLEETPERETVHPLIATLTEALGKAREAKAEGDICDDGQKALDDAIARRFAARTAMALSKMLAAAGKPPIDCEVGALGNCIAVAEKELVDAEAVEKSKAHLTASFKAQSEGGLEPLSRPQEISHEGFQIIDPLKAALDEARKRGAEEDLLIKGQAKLDFWIEARNRRDKAKKELDASLSPPPVTVDQPKVHACLTEASDAKLDPALIKEAVGKLKVAELAQRVYSKAKAPPGTLAIDVLEKELEEVGGSALAEEQLKQKELEKTAADLKEKIDLIKDTKENQKQRDAILAKQVKKGAHKQKAERHHEDILPAWVRDDDVLPKSPSHALEMESVAAKQDEELKELEGRLKSVEGQLKAQEEVVKALTGTVIVPQDVVIFAQLKLKASKTCDEMQKAQLPKLLDLDLDRLKKAIKACEFKFGNLEIAGLDELECNVPRTELDAARGRLKDADRAQKRQARARSQLQVRVNAPTGTATFDILVKLVAEAREAEVEEDLIARAEIKLKKMEELAASSLRAGPLAFISFHLPCLRSCVSSYAISLVEQAEVKRRGDAERQAVAASALTSAIGDWQKGQINKKLMDTDVGVLKGLIVEAAHVGCSQELIECGRQKLVAIDKYKIDKERGLIKDDEPKKEAAAEGGAKKKPKFKNYGYVKTEPTEEGGG